MDATALVLRFAADLGWRGLARTDIRLTPECCGSYPVGTIVTSWSTKHLKFFIQINQAIPGESGAYKVSVVAERYDIGPMAFVTCRFATRDEATDEARRLTSLFARDNFRNKGWRRRYLEQHPEKLLRQKKKWRGWKGHLCATMDNRAVSTRNRHAT